ncbi:MAG: hypothetical protein CSA33_04390 [Desulfobulbus propionicus]|nr:MAG: hypothetical protein CSA33_04390 [Desulfobulbus propionicus]
MANCLCSLWQGPLALRSRSRALPNVERNVAQLHNKRQGKNTQAGYISSANLIFLPNQLKLHIKTIKKSSFRASFRANRRTWCPLSSHFSVQRKEKEPKSPLSARKNPPSLVGSPKVRSCLLLSLLTRIRGGKI